MRFEVNERIRRIYVENGQYVEKGTKIAELSNFELKNRYLQSQVNFENARIELRDYLIGLGYEYADSANIPQSVMETAKLKSGFQRAKHELELTRFNYEASVLYAPASGTVANLNAKENTFPRNNQPFCTIMDMQVFEMVFPVMESELSVVRKGQEVKIVPYFNEKLNLTGKITAINPVVDENGLTEARAVIPDSRGLLYEGMNAKIFINQSIPGQLVIPKKAVTLRTEREVVFVYKDGLAKWVYVDTGMENNEYVTVKEKLEPGDSIIVSGNIHLAHDARVVLK